ncbi:MAG TPA: hypothetical protein VK120_00750 [Sporosarcina sp.]|nr:hypothetical protein [Sporosarcina sp.]
MYKESQYITLKDHHWLDFGFDGNPITATYPEFFNYIDLINLWNDFVSKYKQYEQLIVTRDNNNEIRRLHYSLNSSSRFLVISSIIFVESYLYYLFYSIKNNNTYSNDDRVKGILNRRGYIQDTQIVEDIIFKLFEEVENNQFIKKKYDLYEQSIELRNRLVHTSAFVDESNNLSQLHPLIDIDLKDVISIAQNSIDFVVKIDELLPDEDKILIWWDRFDTPDFYKLEPINTLNIYRS